MDNESFLKLEKEGSVAWLVLNRPKQRNTMTMEFFQEIRRLFEELDADPDVRVIVIRAEGKALPRVWILLRRSLCSGMARPFTVNGSVEKYWNCKPV